MASWPPVNCFGAHVVHRVSKKQAKLFLL